MGNVNQRLNGLNALAYIGVNAVQPPDFVTKKGPPTSVDSRNMYLGNLWLDTTNTPPTAEDVWMLVSLIDGVATWVHFGGGGGGGTVSQFTADAGTNPVLPDGGGNVNLFGAHGINTDATTNTLTFAINNDIELGDLAPIAFGAPALRAVTGNVQIDSGNLTLPTTTQEDVGVIQVNGINFIHSFGTNNTFLGSNSGNFTMSGGNNLSAGTASLNLLSNGSHNVTLGESAGSGYVTGESSNILIGSQVTGTGGESHVLRIGNGSGVGNGQLQEAFIAGIHGVTPGGGSILNVTIDTNGQLGTGGGSVGTTSFVTDSGTVVPNAGAIGLTTAHNVAACGASVLFVATTANHTAQLVVTDGLDNTFVGTSAGSLAATGINNCSFGALTLTNISSGSNNLSAGFNSGINLLTGSNCVFLGDSAGSAYTGAESSNILIGSQVTGTIAESNTLRAGAGTGTGTGQLQSTFISGIQGVNVGSVASVVSINGDQLGTATLTAGTNITITPTANTITIDASAAGGVTSITGDTGAAQTGALTLTGGTTGISFGGSAGTITTTLTTDSTQWNAVLNFGGSSTGINFSDTGSYYTRIGNTVFFNFNITFNSTTGASTGSASITGMPWTVTSFGVKNGFSFSGLTLSSGCTTTYFNMMSGAILLEQTGSATGPGAIDITNTSFGVGPGGVNGSGVYFLGH